MPMIKDESVALVIAGRAIQYFEFDKFFQECKRVLKPNGVVAYFSSDHARFVIENHPTKADKLNELFRKLREVDTAGFWEGQIGIKQRKYADIHLPFDDVKEIRDNSIFKMSKMSLSDLLTLFKSVPAFVKFKSVRGQEVWDGLERDFVHNFLAILELPVSTDLSSVILDVSHDYFVIMARK